MMENELPEDCLLSTMSFMDKDLKGNLIKEVELIPGGKDIDLTEKNKKLYAKNLCHYSMTKKIEK